MDMSFDLKEEALFVPWIESYPLDPGSHGSDKKNFIQLNRAFSAIPDFDAKRIVAEFAVRENCWGQFRFRVQMSRRPEGTLGRVASLCALLGVATLSTFGMNPVDGHDDRVGFLITCILAFVAFQFIVSSSLPPTPYLTLLDRHTLSSFTYLTLLLCTISILARCDIELSYRIYIDNCLFFISAAIVAGIQIWFFVIGVIRRRHELSKLRMTMRQLDDMNKGEDDSPVNVYGSQQLSDCSTNHSGDPFCSFEGLETQ
jgi:hypothetical protein